MDELKSEIVRREKRKRELFATHPVLVELKDTITKEVDDYKDAETKDTRNRKKDGALRYVVVFFMNNVEIHCGSFQCSDGESIAGEGEG